MKKLLGILILFICFNSNSQNLTDSLNYYYQKQDFDRGIVYANKLLKKKNLDKFELAQINSWEAIFNERLNNNVIAENFFNKSIDLLKNDSLYENDILNLESRLADLFNKMGIELSNESQFLNAEKYFKKSLDLYIKLGENYGFFAVSNSLILTLNQQSKFIEARTLIENVLNKYGNKNNIEYMGYLHTYSNILNDLSDYKNAEKNLLLIKDYLEGSNELNNDLYYKCLHSLGNNSLDNLEFIKAENFLNKSLIFAKDKTDYSTILGELASVYYLEAKYEQSEKTYLEALEICKNTFGVNHYNYAGILGELGNIYEKKSDYVKAKEMYIESSESIRKIYGENSIDYAKSLNKLGVLYDEMNDYGQAEEYLIKSTEITKKILGENSEDYIGSLDNLTKFYISTSNYNKADYYASLGLLKTQKYFPENSNDLAQFSGDIASINFEIGNYIKAKENYLIELELNKKIYGINHPNTASSISNLGFIYLYDNNIDIAEQYFLKEYEIIKKIYGDNNYRIARSLNNISVIQKKRKLFNKAIEYNNESLRIINESIGSNNLSYAESLICLAENYFQIKDFINAEKKYLEALEIKQKILGNNNKDSYSTLDNLSTLYNYTGQYEKEKEIRIQTVIQFKNEINKNLDYLSQKEFNFYIEKFFYRRFTTLSFLNLNFENKNEMISSESYENELLVKGLLLRNQQRIQNNIKKSSDATLKINYNQFVANKRQLVKLQELPLDKRPSTFEKLVVETELLEKDLTRESALFADAKKSLSTTWKQIQEKLKPNEVAIDVVVFNYYNKKWTDSIVYSAFVVGKSSKYPKYIPLFEQKQLNALLQRNYAEHDSLQARKLNKQYTDIAIADLFLKLLQNELQNITTIYLSPAGLGHQINFSALPVSDNQTLGEKYALHLLGSTTSLIDFKPSTLNKKENTELLLYGDIDYGKTNALKQEINNESTLSAQIDFNESNTRGVSDSFGNLGGTLKEINKIADLAKEKGFQSTQIKQADATEESIKALDGRNAPYVLHLATHGFFFPDPKVTLPNINTTLINESLGNGNRDAMFKSSEDPMMRSGLALAGANKYWKKTIEKLTTEDGILTASEISNLDLSACQLVVLSACETGLGTINGSEGVYGLQRAFKMAGVKNIIMSLWKVPNTQTAELFDAFYSECFAGKTIHEAFQVAQSKMKAKYSPYYWAGFVLLE
jgi:CHAT domain-containing protein